MPGTEKLDVSDQISAVGDKTNVNDTLRIKNTYHWEGKQIISSI